MQRHHGDHSLIFASILYASANEDTDAWYRVIFPRHVHVPFTQKNGRHHYSETKRDILVSLVLTAQPERKQLVFFCAKTV